MQLLVTFGINMILFIVGLLVVLGGVGGVEQAPDNISLMLSLFVTVLGLGLMWANVGELNEY
jgi:hypothetical protein